MWIGLGTVTPYLQRARAAGLTWPVPADLDDAALEARLFAHAPRVAEDRAVPPWPEVHQELKKAGVTLTLLWEEYRAVPPANGGRSWTQRPARKSSSNSSSVCWGQRPDTPKRRSAKTSRPG